MRGIPKRVVIESPYAGDVKRNMEYLDKCIYDSIKRGEAPFASHKMYTDALDDKNPIHRKMGIEAGYQYLKNAYADQVFYADLGYSNGMKKAMIKGYERKIDMYERFIYMPQVATKSIRDKPKKNDFVVHKKTGKILVVVKNTYKEFKCRHRKNYLETFSEFNHKEFRILFHMD